ncbi:MAG: DUF3422 domain-containing protein [Robiginitomaculum sp.]
MTTAHAPLPQHPDRSAIQAEAHARPPMSIDAKNAQVWHWVLHGVDMQSPEWPSQFDPQKRHDIIAVEDGIIRFEKHTEFVSLTYCGKQAPAQSTCAIIRRCGGRQLAGVKVHISKGKTATKKSIFGTARIFGGEALFEGCRAFTDFQIRDDGMVQYLVKGQFEDGFARGRLVKRLLDLETYRMAALMGLPIVREAAPQLEHFENQATRSTKLLAQSAPDELPDIIKTLSGLLSEIVAFKDKARFRVAASLAYYSIVQARLESLDEKTIGQGQTLNGFVVHRLNPAMNTIKAFERRIDELSSSIASAMALARTQLDLLTQEQNQNVLKSMDRRARQQLHISQAVEGLSVAAITYYAIGLLGTIIKGLPNLPMATDPWKAALVPIIALTVWFNVRRARKKIDLL